MSVEFTTNPSGERFAILPEAEYFALLEAAEDASDAAEVRRFRERHEAGGEELLPAALVERLVEGDSPVRVWREHRGLSLRELARRAELSAAYLSEIESGKKTGGVAALKRLAAALDVDLDDLA